MTEQIRELDESTAFKLLCFDQKALINISNLSRILPDVEDLWTGVVSACVE